MTAQSVHWVGPYVFSKQEIQQGVVVFVDTPDRIYECKRGEQYFIMGSTSL